MKSLNQSLQSQSAEIQSLKQSSSTLSKTVSILKEKFSSLEASIDKPSGHRSLTASPYCNLMFVLMSLLLVQLALTLPHLLVTLRLVSDDRKFNVVIFGVPECKSDLPRKLRLLSDLNEVSTLFQNSSPPTSPSSIVDCLRLGKFSSDRPRPRPILVQFNSLSVVIEILRHRSLFNPYIIKQDLPPELRASEQLLLKERWQMVQSGLATKGEVKIRGNRIL